MNDEVVGIIVSLFFVLIFLPIRLILGKKVKNMGGLSNMHDRQRYIYSQLMFGSNLFVFSGVFLLIIIFLRRGI